MTNIELNLDVAMTNLEGKPYEGDDTLGKVLSNRLAYTNKGESIKYYDWALAFWSGKTVTIDEADLEKLIKFVEDDEQLVNLSKAQLIKALKDSKEKKEPKKK